MYKKINKSQGNYKKKLIYIKKFKKSCIIGNLGDGNSLFNEQWHLSGKCINISISNDILCNYILEIKTLYDWNPKN